MEHCNKECGKSLNSMCVRVFLPALCFTFQIVFLHPHLIFFFLSRYGNWHVNTAMTSVDLWKKLQWEQLIKFYWLIRIWTFAFKLLFLLWNHFYGIILTANIIYRNYNWLQTFDKKVTNTANTTFSLREKNETHLPYFELLCL